LDAQALTHGSGKYIGIPAVKEVTVESVTSGVTVREGELPTVGLADRGYTVKYFEEEMRQLYREFGRTMTIIDLREIVDVSIVRKEKIYAVPARLHLNLSAEAVGTVGDCHMVGVRNGVAVIEADETDTICNRSWRKSLVTPGHSSVVVVASKHVSRQHLESRRKWFGICNITTAEVVNSHSSIGNLLEGAITVLVV